MTVRGALFRIVLFTLIALPLVSHAVRNRDRVVLLEHELAECQARPAVVVADPAPAVDHVAEVECAEPAVAPCPPCARRTRPAASDRWAEHAAREWRLCEEALDSR